jgi:hypothetical protein
MHTQCCVAAVTDRPLIYKLSYHAVFDVLIHYLPIIMTGKHLKNKAVGQLVRENRFRTQSESIMNFENCKTLTSLSEAFNLATSTVKIILKENECIQVHICDKVSGPLKSTVIMKGLCLTWKSY